MAHRKVTIIGGATILLTLAVSLLFLNGCGSSSTLPPTPTPWPTPIVVQQSTYTVTRGSVTDYIILDGRASPVYWDPLYFKVDGKLSVLNVSEGQFVRKDDILAELDTKVLSDQLAQARLTLEQAQNQAQQQQASSKYALERARLTLRMQELTLEKMRRAAGQGPTPQLTQAQAELERARVNLQRAQEAYDAVASRPNVAALPQSAALQTATIDYKLAEARYMQALSDMDSQLAMQELQVQLARLTVQELEEKANAAGGSDVNKAQIQVDALERQIEDRRLRAPYDGQVVAIGINLQGLTKAFAARPKVGDNIAAYAALVVIAKPEPLEITVDSSQKRVSELYVGQPVTITHSAWARPFSAEITALPVAMSDSGNQMAGGQAVHIALPRSAPPMANGDPVKVTIEAETHRDTLFLHPAAVRRFAGRTFVVVQEGDKQRRIDVKAGLENSEQVEILSGLNEGDVVVGP
jgi:multidrug efflux pump subunit AcrA (membrane-fusion protein)